MIKTELCEMLGVKYPVIQAGMGPYSTSDLCKAVANAGAVGIISGMGMMTGAVPSMVPEEARKVFRGATPYDRMRIAINEVKEATKESKGIFGVNIPVPVEVGKVSIRLINAIADARNEDPDVEERLKVIITSAGNPGPVAKSVKASGVKWFHVSPSVYHAKKSESVGVDAVIASGHEGGAHIAWDPVHTMVLLPAVTDAVKVPVIGAGGFCDGKTLAAALSMGAIGVQMGTRFIATKDSDFVQMWKDYILNVGERDTIVGRGLAGPMRYLKNESSVNIAKLTLEEIPALHLGSPEAGTGKIMAAELQGFGNLLRDNIDEALMPGGEAAGRLNSLPTVKEFLEKMTSDAEEIIQTLPKKYL